jgi:hypothetical protein
MQKCVFKQKLLFPFLYLYIFKSALATVCPSNTTISYYVEANKVVEGVLIEKFETQLLSECGERCRINSNCYGANFLLTTDESTVCLLMDTRKKGSDAEIPTPDAIIYSLRPYCRAKSAEIDVCNGRIWTFEKYRRVKIIDSKFAFVEKRTFSLDQCLSECANRKNCEAIEFDQSLSLCRLLSVSLQSVHSIWKFFALSQKTDIYERNCQSQHLEFSKCTFLRLSHAGFTDVFDVRLDAVADKSTCERICISWNQGTCRSYTYDKKSQRCYLSHTAPRLFGRRPMDNLNEDLAFGELDDCMHFSLNCKSDSLTLSGKSMKMFDGAFKSRKGTNVMCQTNVTSAYEFNTEMKYGECGVEKKYKPIPSFIGTILVKEGSTDMITIKDKMIQVRKKLSDNNLLNVYMKK